MSKKTNDELRANYVQSLMSMLKAAGETPLMTNSNEVAIPVVDSEGEDQWVVFVCKIPTGSRDGDVYDGYMEAESYQDKLTLKAAKAEESAKKKAAKQERDQKAREAKAAAKAAKANQ